MIVVDTNLIVHFFVKGDHSELAGKILVMDPGWSAPLLWRSEFRNTMVKCVRGELIEWSDAFRIMTEAESLMAGNEYAMISGDVLSLAASSACSAYDAEFVVLARELGIPLVTTDKQLLKSFPETAVSPARFIAR
ncbi:MAG: type II toxin-antitoxin system VapC family toxin [Candidatus Aminicenantes bacterium]|nr:type II toxin-antitoxin system VapC family toxin [Candidatus Aminicenantes bacterium]